MANAAVSDRRNRQVQEAIESKAWKHALSLVEKRMKKGEDTLLLKTWRALALCQHDDESHHNRGVTETLALCNLDPPVADLEIIQLLQTSLNNIQDHKSLSQQLWEKAAKVKPQDEKLQRRWYTSSTGRNDWKNAQKAAMSLQNNFPKERKYYLWAIFMSYLTSQDESGSEAEKKLFGTLAYRMISKAASMVPADPRELLSPPRAIQNAEELYLLLEIYGSQGYNKEALAILDSPNLGPKSRIAQGESTVLLYKLRFLHKAELWDQALSYCRELIGELMLSNGHDEHQSDKASDRTDEWEVWKLLLTSTDWIDTDEARNSTKAFLQLHVHSQNPTRNSRLAYLEFIDTGVKAEKESKDSLLKACTSYLLDYRKKVYCFSDLRPYVHRLDDHDRSKFMATVREGQSEFQHADNRVKDHLARMETMNLSDDKDMETGHGQSEDKEKKTKSSILFDMSTINELQFTYCFEISEYTHSNSSAAKETISDFVCRCLYLYEQYVHAKKAGVSVIDSQTPSNFVDNICLLAVMALVHLDELHSSSESANAVASPYLLQAACILDILLVNSPSNYQARLLLTRIQLLFGMGSQAMRTFSSLKVKFIQMDTTLHHLLTRISTIHPHPAPADPDSKIDLKDRDPLEAVKVALRVYRDSKGASLYGKNAGLDHGSYVNVIDSIKLGRDLQFSTCRLMYALEGRRIQRLYSTVGTDFADVITETTSGPQVDHRDYQGFLDCEPPGHRSIEERLRIGPTPRQRWTSAMTLTDRLFTVLFSCIKPSHAIISPPIVPTPFENDTLSNNTLDSTADAAGMTATEIANWTMHIQLTQLISLLLSDEQQPSDSLTNTAASVRAWLQQTLSSISPTTRLPSHPSTLIPPHAAPFTPAMLTPHWTYLHSSFCTLDTLKATSLLLQFASKPPHKQQQSRTLSSSSSSSSSPPTSTFTSTSSSPSSRPRIPPDTIKDLQELTSNVYDLVRSNAKLIKESLASGILESFLDLILERTTFSFTGGLRTADGGDVNGGDDEPGQQGQQGQQGKIGIRLAGLMETVGGEGWLEMWCDGVRNAWDESVDGILGVKLP